jgi:hypothetical protein
LQSIRNSRSDENVRRFSDALRKAPDKKLRDKIVTSQSANHLPTNKSNFSTNLSGILVTGQPTSVTVQPISHWLFAACALSTELVHQGGMAYIPQSSALPETAKQGQSVLLSARQLSPCNGRTRPVHSGRPLWLYELKADCRFSVGKNKRTVTSPYSASIQIRHCRVEQYEAHRSSVLRDPRLRPHGSVLEPCSRNFLHSSASTAFQSTHLQEAKKALCWSGPPLTVSQCIHMHYLSRAAPMRTLYSIKASSLSSQVGRIGTGMTYKRCLKACCNYSKTFMVGLDMYMLQGGEKGH